MDEESDIALHYMKREITWDNVKDLDVSMWCKVFEILTTYRRKLCNILKFKGWTKIFIEFRKSSWSFDDGIIKDNSCGGEIIIRLQVLQQEMMRKLQERRVRNWVGEKLKHGARMKTELDVLGESEGDIGPTMSQSYDWLRKPYMLNEKVYHWAIKVKLDILPCRSNLHKWKLSRSKRCCKCNHHNETTHHVLNGCKWRLNKKLYTVRHNAIQDLVVEELKLSVTRKNSKSHDPNEVILVDSVPLPAFLTINLRPDLQVLKYIVVPNRKSNYMVDFKCPDTLSKEYRNIHRKNVAHYGRLMENARGWQSTMETFIVSSNGVEPMCSLRALTSLELPRREAQNVIAKASLLAIKESYKLLRNTLKQ